MANQSRTRHDFVIKDLVISIPSAGGRSGGTFMPADDGTVLPWWISPIAGVLVKGEILEAVRGEVLEAVKQGHDLDSIGRAFREGDPDGNPAIQTAIHELGSVVVASAAFSALGGEAGLVDPDKTFETIPTSITPVVHLGLEVHRVSELPRIRKQLAIATAALDKLAAAQAPTGAEVAVVREQLQGALKALG